jgi:hypothetical protein
MTESLGMLPELSSFPLFSDLPPEEISAFESILEEKSLPAGKDLYRQGEPAKYFYILLNGSIQLNMWRGRTPEQTSLLAQGDCLGEEALLGLDRRQATARLETDAVVLRAASAALLEQLRNLPNIAILLRIVAQSRNLVRTAGFRWLAPEETVYLATRKTDFLLVPGLAIPVILGLASLISIPIIYSKGWPDGSYFFSAIGLVAAVLYGIWSALDWGNDYYLVTNRRAVAIRRIPLIYDDRQEVPLGMIQSVSVSSTIGQRAFSFGDVAIRTFTRPILFQSIPNPNAVGQLVERIWKHRQFGKPGPDREEIGRLLTQRLGVGETGDTETEEVMTDEEEAVTDTAPGQPALPLGSLQTRIDGGDVVTYRKHAFFVFRNMFLPSLLILGGIYLSIVTDTGVFPWDRSVGILLAIGVSIGGLLWAVYEYLDWANDLYQITSEQIIALHRTPLGEENRRSAALENILSLEYDRPSFLARIFNFGTVKATVGQVGFTFDEVSDPVRVQEDIFRSMENRRARLAAMARLERREEIADWIEEYHHLTLNKGEESEGQEQE